VTKPQCGVLPYYFGRLFIFILCYAIFPFVGMYLLLLCLFNFFRAMLSDWLGRTPEMTYFVSIGT